MQAYRIKHIPSGLYYQPVRGYIKANLSKRGKVYLTGTNPITLQRLDYIYIQVDKETRVFNLVKDLFPIDQNGDISCRVPKSEFIKEEVKDD